MNKIILILLSVFTLSSCIEFDQKYYINEDLSGKVEVSITLPKIILDLSESFTEDSIDINELEKMFPMVASELEGISAWKDLKFEIDESEDVIRLQSTFYFENINMIDGSIFFISPYVMIKDNDWDVSFTNQDVMELQNMMESNEEMMDSIFENPEFEGFFNAMFANKKRYEFFKDLFSIFIRNFKLSISAEFPGQVTDPKILKVVNGNTATMGMDGAIMVKDMDKVLENEEFWTKKNIKVKERLDMLEKIYESSENFDIYSDMTCLVKNPKGNIFDYKTELESANPIVKDFGMVDFDYLQDDSKIYSSDGKYSISNNNLNMDLLNDEQVIGASNAELETYYMILKDEKATVVSIKSLDEYNKLIKKNMLSRLENGKASNESTIIFHIYNGQYCELYGLIDDLKFKYILITMEDDDYYYQLLTWTFDKTFNDNKNGMMDILKSFRIKETVGTDK